MSKYNPNTNRWELVVGGEVRASYPVVKEYVCRDCTAGVKRCHGCQTMTCHHHREPVAGGLACDDNCLACFKCMEKEDFVCDYLLRQASSA